MSARPMGLRPEMASVSPAAVASTKAQAPTLSADDVATCRASLRHNSRTFHAASLLLPPRVRAPASVLYAFCRLADDAVDLADNGDDSRPHSGAAHAVQRLRERLDRVYAGWPLAQAADRGLAAIVVTHALPRELFDLLLEGLSWDTQARRYDTLEDLHAYAARVAGTVGALMGLLMGVRDAAALARACDLGVAMQLSNIARDVGEDARMGRLYLPRQWLREAGLTPDTWLAQPCFDTRLASVVQRLLAEADRLYARAGAGVASLPLDCRPGINAARLLYREIGCELQRRGTDSVNQRTVVPTRRKLVLLLRAAGSLRPPAQHLHDAVLAANRPLLQAVASLDARRGAGAAAQPDRWAFLVTLFDRLERRDLSSRRAA